MSTITCRIPSQSQPRRQRPRSAPRKAGNRAPWPMPGQHCFRFRIDQSRFCGCHEIRTIAGPDFRALRKARLRRKTLDFHSPCRWCPWPSPGTLNDAALDGNYAATLKSRADHTDRALASQDCVTTLYVFDFTGIIATGAARLWSNHRTAAAGSMAMLVGGMRGVRCNGDRHSATRFSVAGIAPSGGGCFPFQFPQPTSGTTVPKMW